MRAVNKGRQTRGGAPIGAFLALALAGCSTGNIFGPSSSSTASNASSSVSDKMASALFGPPAQSDGTGASTPADEVECPGVEVRPGASTLSIAGKGSDSAALDLRYQGGIVRTARECHVSAGNMTMKIGVEGRLVLGPAGGPGQVDIPLRYAVVHEGPEPKAIVSKLYRVAVTVPPNEGRVSFSHVAEDIAFPMPQRVAIIDSYVVYVGFDPVGAAEAKPKSKSAPKSAPKKPRPPR